MLCVLHPSCDVMRDGARMTVRSRPTSKHVPRKERRYHVKSHLVICLTGIVIRLYWRLMPLPVNSFCDDWWCLSFHYTVIRCVLSPCRLRLPFIYFLFSWCRCFLLASNPCLGRCRINLALTYYARPLVRGEGQRDDCCTSRGRILQTGKPVVSEVRVNRDATC